MTSTSVRFLCVSGYQSAVIEMGGYPVTHFTFWFI